MDFKFKLVACWVFELGLILTARSVFDKVNHFTC